MTREHRDYINCMRIGGQSPDVFADLEPIDTASLDASLYDCARLEQEFKRMFGE